MSFDNWRARLAGKTIKTFLQPQLEDEGYYRRPITEAVLGPNGKTNGQKRIIGWEPVAYFIDRGKLCGVIGNRDMAANEVTDEHLWSWVCRHPIKEETFRAVAERGEPWPDTLPKSVATTRAIEEGASTRPFNPEKDAETSRWVEPANREVIGDNSNTAPVDEPHIEHGEAIDRAVGAALDLKITDEASAAILLGAKNRIAELRLAADKAGHAIYDPLRVAYEAEQKKWPGMVKKAKDAETALNTRYLRWREEENRKAAEAAAEQVRLAREADEANQRAADRAIAAGVPEEPPEIIVPEPVTSMPAPVTPTYRAPGQRIAPKEVETWHLDGIDDYDAVYNHLKNNQFVKTQLMIWATAQVKNGQEVPGTRRHFGLI